MVINDRAYGKINIPPGVISDLINSSPVQRLKKINQSGGPVFLEPKRDITRFEHSIGVWYILEKFGAGLEEQVAGLLHDTPHTAFSHVADVVFSNESHNFHEQFEAEIILKSEIPNILNKHKIGIKKIFDKSNFHLLEAELPDLSADRIDYFFRDTRPDQLFPAHLITEFLSNMYIKKDLFVFKERSIASLYAILFLNAGRLLWLDPNSHGSFYLLANILKRALEMKRLELKDFFKTDEEVVALLRNINDSEIKSGLKRLSPSTRFIYSETSVADYTGPNKPRIVDPWVFEKGSIKRVSELIPRLKELFDHYKKTYKILSVAQIL